MTKKRTSIKGSYKKLFVFFCIVIAAETLIHTLLESSAPSGLWGAVQDGILLAMVTTPFLYMAIKAQKATREEKNKVDEILACMGDNISIQDRDMRILYQNSAMKELMGDTVGEYCYKAYEEKDAICKDCPVEQSFKDGQIHRKEKYVDARGREVYIAMTSSPIRDTEGNITSVIEVVRDMTADKINALRQAGVAELGQFALMGYDLSAFLEKAIMVAADGLGVEYAKVLELSPDGESLLLIAGTGWKEGLVGKARVGAGADSQAGYTLLTDDPVIVEDLKTERRFNGPQLLFDHGVVSGLSVIIPGREKPYGVLGVHTKNRKSFSQDDISFLRSVANIVAEAVAHKKYERAIVERNLQLSMLNQINKAMVSTLDLDRIFEILVDNLTAALGMESGIILLYDDIHKSVNVVKSCNLDLADGKACFPLDNLPLVSEAIRNNKPIILDEVGRDTTAYGMLGAVSLAIIPMGMNGLVQGVICLHNRLARHYFTDSEIILAMQAADQAMIAIINAKLVKSLTDNDIKLVAKNRELLALNEVAAIIASNQEIEVMLRAVLEKTLSLPFLEVQKKGVIFLRDEKKPASLYMAANVGLADYLVKEEHTIIHGHCLCGLVAEKGEIICSGDCFDDPRHTTNYPGMKSHGHIALPIKNKDEVLGVMTFYLEPESVPSESDIRFLTGIANQIAIGVMNRRFFDRISIGKKEWETTFDAIDAVITIHGPDFEVLRANKTALDFFGKGAKEVIGRKCYELFHEAKYPSAFCPAKKMLEGIYEPQVSEQYADGKYYEVSIYPLISDGKLNSFVHVLKDITRRKEIERALRESEEQFRKLVEQSIVGVYIIQDGVFKYVNPRHAEIFGYTPEEIVGMKKISELVYPEDWPLVQENIRKREAGEVATLNYSFRGITKQGKIIYVEIHGTNIIYSGRTAGMGTLIDITETIHARDELVKKTQEAVILKQAQAQLEEVNRLKSEFLANMSHELRTPLNAVIGLSQVLLEGTYGPLAGKQEEYLKGINDSGQHLIGLINEILDLSKIEAGKEQLEFAEFSLSNLLNNSFVMVKEKAMRHGIELVREIQPGVGTYYGDERRMKQIIYNLLSNAVKFTNPGGKVGLRASQDMNSLTITVWDTGIGIPDNKKHLIFQPFQLVDNSLSRRHEGTGLGLVLTKKLVEMHKGSIFFNSREGEGTSFTILLPPWDRKEITPSKEITKTVPAVNNKGQFDGNRIMVVEDNKLNLMLVVDYLKKKGCETIEALNGEAALKVLETERPELILCDIQMPGMDGFATVKKIRETPELADIPVIAMTAFAMKGDCEKCLEAGFDDYISKPVHLNEMLDKISARLKKGALHG